LLYILLNFGHTIKKSNLVVYVFLEAVND